MALYGLLHAQRVGAKKIKMFSDKLECLGGNLNVWGRKILILRVGTSNVWGKKVLIIRVGTLKVQKLIFVFLKKIKVLKALRKINL